MIGDLGINVFIKGFLVEGNGVSQVILVPREQDKLKQPELVYTTPEEYKAIIKQLDTQEIEIFDYSKNTKVIVRKSQRNLDQRVSWEIFKRDNYQCRYCGVDGVPMTYDHVQLWENGGDNTVENGVTACKKCNQTRGNKDYSDWLDSPYYLKVSKNITDEVKEANEELRFKYKEFKRRVSRRRR
jgi:hypothetical protein